MSLGNFGCRGAMRWLCCLVAPLLVAVPASAQSENSEDGSAVVISVSGAAQAGAERTLRRNELSQNVASPRQAASVNLSVSRGADLVGRPTRAVREQLGDDVASSSYSDQPIVIIGAKPNVSGAPLANLTVTSRFGSRRHPIDGVRRQHAGVDYRAAHGTPIMATGDGTVVHAGPAGGYGLLVRLDHGNGLETRYAHMSRVAVSVGDRTSSGQIIGYVGSTGRSTGSHLHYETRVNGRAVDPADR